MFIESALGDPGRIGYVFDACRMYAADLEQLCCCFENSLFGVHYYAALRDSSVRLCDRTVMAPDQRL